MKCDICIEEQCKKTDNPYSCDCSTCKNQDACDKWIHPTIRITTKCTQSCSHCCFECSPSRTEFMSIEVAEQIRKFIKNNEHIRTVNLMGGEIICNPEFERILHIILGTPSLLYIRIVSNSDWATNHKGARFLKTLSAYKDKIKVALSKDKWHTNAHVDFAAELLKAREIPYYIDEGEMVEDAIVPIGRSVFHYNIYSMFGTYCSGSRKYSILITEDGSIHKCSFGAWDYDNVSRFLDGGFSERFKEFHQAFHKCFISNCAACIRASERKIKKS